MKDFHQVIKGPLITEKSTSQKESARQYAFMVDPRANKVEIKQAVERIFKVKVAGVRTLNVMGKVKRVRMHLSRQPHWKKAVVTLKDGSIEIFEGA
jgi:large subunit ribosomal protein L23